MHDWLPYVGTLIVALVGAGGLGPLVLKFWSGRLIGNKGRLLDAKARAEDARTEIGLSQEARQYLDDARAEAVLMRADRDTDRKRIAQLEEHSRAQDAELAQQRERIYQLEEVIRDARLAMPPWPSRRGYPH